MRKGIKKAVALFCAVVLTATSITLWNAPANAEAADTTTEPTPVKLEGYKNITASSFLDGSGNPMEDKAYSNGVKSYSLGQGLDGFDKTLLSLKLSFDKAADINDEVNSRIQVAGNKDDLGIMIYPSYTGSSLRIVFMEGMTNTKHTLNVYDSTITEKRFLGEFLLQMSFDYIDSDSDGSKDMVRLGVYVNGSKVDLVDGSLKPTSSDIPNCNIDTAFGKCLTTYCGSRSVTIESVGDTDTPEDDDEENTPDELKEFHHITTSGFYTANGKQMANKTYKTPQMFYLKHDLEGTPLDNYDKTVLSLKLTFKKEPTAEGLSRIDVLGKDNKTGIMVYPSSTGNALRIIFLAGMAGEKQVGLYVHAKDFVKDYAGYFFNEFEFQMSTDYVDTNNDGVDDSVTLGVYIDGNECDIYSGITGTVTSATIPNCDFGKFGTCLRVLAEGEPIKVLSVGDGGVEEPEEEESGIPNENFKKITFAHAGIEDGKYVGDGSSNFVVRGKVKGGFDKKVFCGDIFIEDGSQVHMMLGGKDSPWYGLTVNFPTSGKPNLTWGAAKPMGFYVGVPDVVSGKWVNIMISTEIIDADEDGLLNDVKMGLWFDGQLIKSGSFIISDRAEELGENIAIYCATEGSTISIRSIPELIEPFDYARYGLTEDWENTLLNTGLTTEIPVGGSVQTGPNSGDNTNLIYIALLVVSVIGLGWYAYQTKKNNKQWRV